jgi:hypothetical protein
MQEDAAAKVDAAIRGAIEKMAVGEQSGSSLLFRDIANSEIHVIAIIWKDGRVV